MNPNATWSVSLESYYPYLQPQEVSKAPTTSCTYSSLPKSAKRHFFCLKPLGDIIDKKTTMGSSFLLVI
jgi:hypothetical protein